MHEVKTMITRADLKFRATHGTAIYTGGGIYNVIGQLDNGLWFYGGNDYIEVFDEDTRTYDEVNDGLACYWNDWCDKHRLEVDKRQLYAMFYDFCQRLDNRESGLTDGYEEFSNYAAGEVTDYIDFSYFDDIECGVDFSENNQTVPKELKRIADDICRLTQADGIRQYFDFADKQVVFESSTIFNFFAFCEEIAGEIADGNYSKAEELINDYKKW